MLAERINTGIGVNTMGQVERTRSIGGHAIFTDIPLQDDATDRAYVRDKITDDLNRGHESGEVTFLDVEGTKQSGSWETAANRRARLS